MVTLHLNSGEATLPQVLAKLGLKPHEVDSSFGVVTLDPQKHLYAILADESVAAKIEGHASVSGSFSNPKIETFGPPKS
jgi:hypothetical protein